MTYDPSKGQTDAFQDLRVQAGKNLISVPSHYKANPERNRLFVDGQRQNFQYGFPSQYEFADDVHLLKPNAGETVTFETAEKPPYTVQFEIEYSFAFQLNQALQNDGDLFRVGPFDSTRGYFLEKDHEHDPLKADFVIRRASSEVLRREDIDIEHLLTDFTLWEVVTNWYNVGNQRWKQSFTDNFIQEYIEITKTSIDGGGRGPEQGNLPLRYQIQASPSTSGLILEAGSMGAMAVGDVDVRERQKGGIVQLTYGGSGDWEPIQVWRINEDKGPVQGSAAEAEVLGFTGTGDAEVALRSHDPSLVLNGSDNPIPDGDFEYDEYRSSASSAITTATTVAKAPDENGNPVETATNPGGFLTEYAARTEEGGVFSTGSGEQAGVGIKSPIYSRDYVVAWGKAPEAGDIKFFPALGERW